MSHEIRTPLNGVLGMAQAMERDPLPGPQAERLAVIRQSGEALLVILNDVLDLSKIEAGKLDLEIIEFDLATVARGAQAAFTALAQKKGLSLNLVIQAGAGGRYQGDPVRLRQILCNLLSNALKFTACGEVTLDVSREGEMLRLAVSDTGEGIPPDRLPRLFERFAQADASTTRRFGGTGLGLAICRQLAELMGGDITATSTPDEGSRFEVTLRLPRLGEEAPASEPLDLRAPSLSAERPLRVLAAEDNPVNQLVLKTLLDQMDVAVQVVSDGREAVAAWSSGTWDLILMDVQMPNMDGVSATREIRTLEAAARRPRTPIVALTANVMAHQIGGYLAAGMDDHVEKPLDVRRLFEAITRATLRASASSPSL